MQPAGSPKAKPQRRLNSLQTVFGFVVVLSISVSLYLAFLPSTATLDVAGVKRMYLDSFLEGASSNNNNNNNKNQASSSSAAAASATKKKKKVNYHVIFSTGCSLQQDWESYVLFYHAFKVKQPGNVTRLAAGCSASEETKLRIFHQESIATMSDRFHVHFTPEFSRAGGIPKDYKYNNKPNSVADWMANVLNMGNANHSKAVEDDIVILMDPDMILLRPLLHDFSDQNVIYATGNPTTKVVRHGMPMAQQDGYLSDEWQKFNVSYITQGGTFPKFKNRDGFYYWNSGPPYLATVRDMWNMVSLWKDYVPRVYEEYPQLFAEMYGLIISKTQLGLPHTLVKSIVVSTTETEVREGWALVDALPDDSVCIRTDQLDAVSRADLPIALHYCGRYMLGKFFFSKYRLKKKYISCETPLLTHPPNDIATLYDYAVRPPPDRGVSHDMEIYNVTQKQAKREAFMLCGLISAVNEAATYFKRQHCGNTGNYSEVYNFHDDPYSLKR